MGRERIGIFGGTFNPIHKGHVKAALVVQKVFSLKRILFIPSYIPPHKGSSDIASPHHRLKMVEMAVAPYPQFVPSSIEMEAKGTSYSIRTLEKLRAVYPDSWISFIVGVDAFLEINTWKEHEKLLEECHFIVISRPGYRLDNAKNILGGKYSPEMLDLSGLKEVKDEDFMRFSIFLMPFNALKLASKEVRRKVQNGESIQGQVAEPVAKYIRQNRLYKGE